MPDRSEGRPMALDGVAESACPELPAFLAPPAGAPAYHGFPIIEETDSEGWRYGAITDVFNPQYGSDGCEVGDGFVVAPDGSRAGLVWEVGSGPIEEVIPPEGGRWGVWAVWFSRPIRTMDDLISNFRDVLPDLQERYREAMVGKG